jgi:hypothetical protein
VAETTLTSIKVAPNQMELREFPIPELDEDSALMKVEVAGV